MVRVEIDRDSGFCFGVVYAISIAEAYLKQKGTLYCLGDLVHNDMEIKRLEKMGLRIIHHADLSRLKDVDVLVRAHGEPAETYRIAQQNRLRLIDASCPIVLKLQNRIREAASSALPNAQFVIYGKATHPELIGLRSQVPAHITCLIVEKEADLDSIDYTRPIYLFSQTTMNLRNFYALAEVIRERARQHNNPHVFVYDTICRQVSNREEKLRRFARQHDVILFVAGRKSSNGRVLYEVCRQENPATYYVVDPAEVRREWLVGAQSIGICGATSTPQWLMEQTREYVLQLVGGAVRDAQAESQARSKSSCSCRGGSEGAVRPCVDCGCSVQSSTSC